MTWKEQDLPALRELESAALDVWKRHPEMTDHAVARAYEAAFQHYRARLRGHEPKPPGLAGLDFESFQTISAVCEKLIVTGATPMKGAPAGNVAPISFEKLAEMLRELHRSVERHTKQGGRQGYLGFVRSFIP